MCTDRVFARESEIRPSIAARTNQESSEIIPVGHESAGDEGKVEEEIQ